MTKQVLYTVAKETKRATRVWMEGLKLSACGFVPEATYTINEVGPKLVLRLDPDGDRKVTKSSRNGKARPIIDLHSQQVAKFFTAGQRIQVVFTQGEIVVSKHHEDSATEVREATFKHNIGRKTITEASLFTGGGHLD